MKISDYEKFHNRVLIPLSVPFYAFGAYLGLFMNVYCYGQPITFFVSFSLIGVGIFISNYKPKERNGH
jgi:hypothetical protein